MYTVHIDYSIYVSRICNVSNAFSFCILRRFVTIIIDSFLCRTCSLESQFCENSSQEITKQDFADADLRSLNKIHLLPYIEYRLESTKK